MRSVSGRWLRWSAIGLIALAVALLPGAVGAQQSVTVRLEPMGASGVNGTAILTANGEATDITLEIRGLAANATARATMQAGACAMPSASFATLPDLKADASGVATGRGAVRFRGTEDVALATMADGEHIIAIQAEQVVACGVIPAPETGSAAEVPMAQDRGLTGWLIAVVVAIVALGALLVGLSVRRRRQRG